MNNSHMINGSIDNNIVDTLSYKSEALDNSQIYKSRPGILQKLNSGYKGLKMGLFGMIGAGLIYAATPSFAYAQDSAKTNISASISDDQEYLAAQKFQDAQKLKNKSSQIKSSDKLIQVIKYKVKENDTLSEIILKNKPQNSGPINLYGENGLVNKFLDFYGVEVEEDAKTLPVGITLEIPIDFYGAASKVENKTEIASTKASVGPINYTVKRGDTLSDIIVNNKPEGYKMKKNIHIPNGVVDRVTNDNKLKNKHRIYPGQKIKIDLSIYDGLVEQGVMQKIKSEVKKSPGKESTSAFADQCMLYMQEQAATTAVGIKLEKDLQGKDSQYDRNTIGGRVSENWDNAGKNLQNAGSGLINLVEGLAKLPGKIGNGFTWGLIPEYNVEFNGPKDNRGFSKADDGFANKGLIGKILHPLTKIIGDGVFGGVVNPALDTIEGAGFAALNSVQMIPDSTISCIDPIRKHGTDNVFNTVYAVADLAVQAFPGGDASQRVHSIDSNKKHVKGWMFVNNFYTDSHIADKAGWDENFDRDSIVIKNTPTRQWGEFIPSIIEDILLFKWFEEAGKDSGSKDSGSSGNGGNGSSTLTTSTLGNQVGGGAV